MRNPYFGNFQKFGEFVIDDILIFFFLAVYGLAFTELKMLVTNM